MLKEIMEEPEAIENALRGRIILKEGLAKLGGLERIEEKIKEIEKITIIGMGTALLAGKIGEYMLEEYAGLPVEVENASEFRYKKLVFEKAEAILIISQSGETADTLFALKEAKRKGILTLGIVNVVGSSIAREVEAGIYNHAGPEIGVAATKSFVSQLTVLALLTIFLGRQREMSLVMGKRILEELIKIPDLARKVLAEKEKIEESAKKYSQYKNFLFLSRKYNYPIALEGALKLKEISYLHAEGYPAGEMKHGPIALIDENFPTVALCPSGSVYEKMISNIEEIKTRKGKILALTTEGNKEIKKIVDDVIYIPKTLEMLTPILSVIPLQLLAYYMAVFLGYDPDRPRNLAKSCTVE
jgi:glucosamine--fructose-6-phosphate aminotransferase (isomerizing)